MIYNNLSAMIDERDRWMGYARRAKANAYSRERGYTAEQRASWMVICINDVRESRRWSHLLVKALRELRKEIT